MAFTQIPQAISEALLGLTQNPIIILLIMNVILLIAGTFMDVTPAILIFTPLFLPVVKTFGMDPVQFGLILVYNLCIGNITRQSATRFRRNQGRTIDAIRRHALYAMVLRRYFGRPVAGHLCSFHQFGTASWPPAWL